MKKITFIAFLALQLFSIKSQDFFMINDGKCANSKKPFYVQNQDFISSHSFDAVKYRLNFDLYNCFVSPYPKSYKGSVVLIYRMDTAAGIIKLDANSSALIIDSVKYSGITFLHQNNILNINLNRIHNPGETDSVKIFFRRNNIIDYSFNNSGGKVYTFLQPEGARMLFPCRDRLHDKALFDFTSKVPANVKIASNGILKDTTITGDSIYYHWVSNDPMQTYLFAISGQVNYQLNYSYYRYPGNPADSIPIMLFYNPVIPPNAGFIQDLKAITDYFSQIFIDYPFEKIGFAHTYPVGNNNMENQTITFINTAWTSGIIPHEHGHQWFGDYITCKTWADFWLNEGFASYLESLYSEHFIGRRAYNLSMYAFYSYYLMHNPGFPIYNSAWENYTPPNDTLFNYAVIYSKSACVIHTLRRTLGDSLFFRTMKSYMTDTNFAFKSASTSDFNAKVNSIAGQDYSWFFDQWIRQPNHPVYQNTMNIIDSGAGGWKLYFTINQVQTNTVFFRMPVKLKINYSDNTDSNAVINNTFNNQTFTFTSARRPVGTFFDYDTSIVPKVANSIIGINNHAEAIPKHFSLYQNYPNPFNASTFITYSLPVESNVVLKIFDMTGKLVWEPVNTKQSAGEYRIIFEGNNFASGVYFYRFEAGNYVSVRKMILLK